MTIDTSILEQLLNTPLNANGDIIVRALVPLIKKMATNIDALIAEIPNGITITQPSGTNTIQITLNNEGSTPITSNVITITQPA